MDPDPVKYLVGTIYREERDAARAQEMLEKALGETDYLSQPFPFDATDYYAAEMGAPLFRRFSTFRALMSPGELVRVKLLCRSIEDDLSERGKRKVNLDPGYMDFGKVVLASFKCKANKIYLDRGVYADPVLCYERGEFLPFPWSFPDLKGGAYREIFLRIRVLYKEGMKQVRERKV